MRLHKNILSRSVSILFIGLMFIGIIHHSYETHHDYPTNQKHFCAWSLQSMAEPAPVVFIVKPKIQERQIVFIKNKINVIIREEGKHRFVRGPPEGAYSSAIFLIIYNHTNK